MDFTYFIHLFIKISQAETMPQYQVTNEKKKHTKALIWIVIFVSILFLSCLLVGYKYFKGNGMYKTGEKSVFCV